MMQNHTHTHTHTTQKCHARNSRTQTRINVKISFISAFLGTLANTSDPSVHSPSKNIAEIKPQLAISESSSIRVEISRKVADQEARPSHETPPPHSKRKASPAQDATRFVDPAAPGQEGVDLTGKVGSARAAPQPSTCPALASRFPKTDPGSLTPTSTSTPLEITTSTPADWMSDRRQHFHDTFAIAVKVERVGRSGGAPGAGLAPRERASGPRPVSVWLAGFGACGRRWLGQPGSAECCTLEEKGSGPSILCGFNRLRITFPPVPQKLDLKFRIYKRCKFGQF
ncbi:Hypothetical predicted protein [Marmota monax]|uniref:Uncharacterized protein n=1 Tax=Marmota monax TaxID=9995 RepID=A0A5E4CS25_MARMO|nr:Hypothetical predicted protein [Marmota monax]